MPGEKGSGLKLVHWLLIAVLVALSINVCFYITDFASRLKDNKPSSSNRLELIAELRRAQTLLRTPDERRKAMIELEKQQEKLRQWRVEADAVNREFNRMPQPDQFVPNIIPL